MKVSNLRIFSGHKFSALSSLFILLIFVLFHLYSFVEFHSLFAQTFIVAFGVSFFIIYINIKYNNLFHKFSNDSDTFSVQKFHTNPVPRTAGIGLIIALFFVAFSLSYTYPQTSYSLWYLLVATLPAFLGGIIEDLTKRVAVKTRLSLMALSAMISFVLLDAGLNRLDCTLIDWIFDYWIVSLFVTMFMVSGVVNAINIIDGFNGLSGLVAIIILSGLCYVSLLVNDLFITQVCFALIGAIFGFLIWNYPKGRIFLGDGGAYLIGFLIADISILLVARNPEVSAWFPFLLALYPIFETLFSIYRKKIVRGMSPGQPDGVHLHMLIYKRLIRVNAYQKIKNIISLNSMTSPYLWALCCISVIPAVLFWQHTIILLICCLLFMITYIWIYGHIVHFRTPKILLFFIKKQTTMHMLMDKKKKTTEIG